MRKLIESAAANAKNKEGTDKDNLVVKNIRVDKGFVFMRFKARARGRAAPIRKRTSHISVVLEAQEQQEKKEKKVRAKS